MTRAEAIDYARARLEEAGFPSAIAYFESIQLLEYITGERGAAFWLGRSNELKPAEEAHLSDVLERRASREPLQLIIGSVNFMGLDIKTAPGVLVPRPETERLVELALELLPVVSTARVLDAGTGSGVIALALKYKRPAIRVFASDIDSRALNLAAKNAHLTGLKVEFLHSSLTAGLRELDLIVSNPPYLNENYRESAPPELAWEADLALYAGPDGLKVALPLLGEAWSALKPGGWLLIELSPENVHSLAAEARNYGFKEVKVLQDLTGRERFLRARR